MSTLKTQIDQFADGLTKSELGAAIGELVKKALAGDSASKAIPIRDCNEETIAYVLTRDAIHKPDLSDYHTLLAVAKYRSENPPDRYLTPEEFIARIEKVPE